MAITQNDPITASDVVAALNEKAESIHSHVVSDITDFPTIPTKTSQLTNDSGFLAGLPSHSHDDRYYTESEIRKNTLYNIVNENTKIVEINNAGTIFLPKCNNNFDYQFFNYFFAYNGNSFQSIELESMEYKEI